MKKAVIKRTNVVQFKKFSVERQKELKELLVDLKIYKDKGKLDYSYTIKRGKKRKTAEFVAYSLAYVIQDIIMYNEDPANVLELTEEMILRLGFEPRGVK